MLVWEGGCLIVLLQRQDEPYYVWDVWKSDIPMLALLLCVGYEEI